MAPWPEIVWCVNFIGE